MQTDIYITEIEKGRQMRIPWLPEKISFSANGTRYASHDLLDLGEARIIQGENLRSYSWESRLPGEGRKEMRSLLRGEWQEPRIYQEIWSGWKKHGTPLRLVATGTTINHDVQLKDYNVTYESGFGDFIYDITFEDYRVPKITSIKAKSGMEIGNGQSVLRHVAEKLSYKIVEGDNLWSIAYRHLGSGLRKNEIYEMNKDIIEDVAKINGLKSSQNGMWLFPGTIIKVPSSGVM